jgi:ribosomal protein L11 methyltransferase
MPQLAVSFALGPIEADVAEAACFGLGALAISYVDLRDDAILEPAPGEFRLWPHSQLQALFPYEASPIEIVAGLATALPLDPAAVRLAVLADRAWEREWLRDFHPMRFGRRLWIAPHHADLGATAATAKDAVVVRLDPGLAFGTGTHPTTALCLTWLDEFATVGARVVDYGCGSGVLAIAAAKLGAAQVEAYDIDPQALIATADNSVANGTNERVRAVASANALSEPVDLLLANILSGPLRELAPRFATLVRPGGSLVLAGLLETQADEVTHAYATWFDIAPFATREGWTALAGRRLPMDS